MKIYFTISSMSFRHLHNILKSTDSLDIWFIEFSGKRDIYILFIIYSVESANQARYFCHNFNWRKLAQLLA